MFFARVPADAPAEYSQFWRLWEGRAYFECHEVLENLWRRESGERKLFYHGLIHCAVALYQVERRNAVGANRQLVRARVKLSGFAPEFFGVKVNELLQEVEREVAPLERVLTAAQRASLGKLKQQLKFSLENK